MNVNLFTYAFFGVHMSFLNEMSEDHEKNLQNRCGYKNCILEETEYPTPKEAYIKEFPELCWDIAEDNTTIYPSKVCRK